MAVCIAISKEKFFNDAYHTSNPRNCTQFISKCKISTFQNFKFQISPPFLPYQFSRVPLLGRESTGNCNSSSLQLLLSLASDVTTSGSASFASSAGASVADGFASPSGGGTASWANSIGGGAHRVRAEGMCENVSK